MFVKLTNLTLWGYGLQSPLKWSEHVWIGEGRKLRQSNRSTTGEKNERKTKINLSGYHRGGGGSRNSRRSEA